MSTSPEALDMTQTETYQDLLAEFGQSTVKLDQVCEAYFGMSVEKARARAPHRLPCNAFMGGGPTLEWRIKLIDLAAFIEAKQELAQRKARLNPSL